MRASPYITWAKERAHLRYSLARSGAPACRPEELEAGPGDLVLHGPDEDGWMPLREAVGDRYGVRPGQVALAHGTSLANHLVCSALLEPGDEVLVEHPGYEPLTLVPELLGARTRRFDRESEMPGLLDPGRVLEALGPDTRMVVLSHPHNPTGRLAGREALKELAGLAESRDFHVLVDEVYLDLAAEAPRTAALLSPRVIATGGLTKSFGLGGLRAGWVIASEETAERVRRLNDLFTVLVAHTTERLALRALERAETLLAPRRALLSRNRERVDTFIRRRGELEWSPPDTGTVGWVRLEGAEVDRLCAVLEGEHESAVAPGRFFGVHDHFRIGFGMEGADLEEALRRLGSALDSLF
ncbi:MAG: pyridoxal phosphate-dependent aminotransferase [bacterium]